MGIGTATLQQLQHILTPKKDTGNSKKVGETFVNRNERLLPLQCQIEIADRRSLRIKIARIKSRNCVH